MEKENKNKQEKSQKQEQKKEQILSASELKIKLQECQKQAGQYLAGWQRARADFLNHKKQEAERLNDFSKYVIQGLILNILPILDNFNLVEKKLPQNLKKNEYVSGLTQIKIQLQDFLKNQGVEEIKCLGRKFDPNFHEAVDQTEQKNTESGMVLEELQKGYKINGRVLRPSKVKVSK